MDIGRLGTGVTDFMNGGPKGFSPSLRTGQNDSSKASFKGIDIATPKIPDPAPEEQRGTSGSASLLSGNFFKEQYKRSRYVQASVERFGAENTMGSRVNALVNELSASITGEAAARSARSPQMDFGYVTAYKYGLRAQRRVRSIVEDDYMKRAEKEMEKTREELEKKAEEALASNRADGTTDDAKDSATSADTGNTASTGDAGNTAADGASDQEAPSQSTASEASSAPQAEPAAQAAPAAQTASAEPAQVQTAAASDNASGTDSGASAAPAAQAAEPAPAAHPSVDIIV